MHGFQEIDAAEYTLSAGHAYQLTETLILCVERYMSLLKQGYTHFRGNKALLENQSNIPHLHIHDDDEHVLMPRRPSFLLLSKLGDHQIAILNNKIVWLN